MDRQFPPEIIQLIVKASLKVTDAPTDDEDDVPTRYSTLRSYSTLNSTWNEISRRFLYKYVTISGKKEARAFVKACQTKAGTKYLVRTLTIPTEISSERGRSNGDEFVYETLECVPRVRTLVIRHNPVHYLHLSQLQNLRRLYLTDVRFHLPSTDLAISFCPSLSLLTHLDCFNCNFNIASPVSFFHPRFLPRLRSLAYRGHTSRADDLQDLAPQLEAILVRSGAACSAILPHADSLLLLSLPCGVSLSTALQHLTLTPRFLHFGLVDSQATQDSLEEQIDNRKKGLGCIFLDTKDAESRWEPMVRSSLDQLELLGIRVEIGEISFLQAIERMDRILREGGVRVED